MSAVEGSKDALTIRGPAAGRKDGDRARARAGGPWFTSVPLPPLIRPVHFGGRRAIRGNIYGEREIAADRDSRERLRQRFNLQIGSIFSPNYFRTERERTAPPTSLLSPRLHSGSLSRSFLVLRLIDFRLSGTPPPPLPSPLSPQPSWPV